MKTIADSHDFRFVGLQIRSYREAKKISQEQLADRAGLATGTIGKIERGINNPKADTLLRIAQELEVPCRMFFDQAGGDHQFFSARIQRLIKYANHLNDDELNALCQIAKIMTDTRHLAAHTALSKSYSPDNTSAIT